jgi:hypothetical protein
MEINKAIRIFSDFLNYSWDKVIPLLIDRSYTSDESSINDWLQANWEILVERNVLSQNGYLEFYGDGADCYGASCRMTDIEADSTFAVKVKLDKKNANDILNNEILPTNAVFSFDKLVNFKNGFYLNEPPFDYVLIQDNNGKDRVFQLENVIFELIKI